MHYAGIVVPFRMSSELPETSLKVQSGPQNPQNVTTEHLCQQSPACFLLKFPADDGFTCLLSGAAPMFPYCINDDATWY